MHWQKILFAAVAGLWIAAARAAEPEAATQAWQALTNLTISLPPASWSTHPPTEADIARFDDQRAADAGVIADKARDFYGRFPKNPHAPASHVMEIQALQTAVHMGATNRLNDLQARESAFVGDTNFPVEMRYPLRVDMVGRQIKERVEAGADARAEMEKAGRALVKEFPAQPAGYQMLLDIAETADLAKMQELASVITNSGGPSELTSPGNGLLRRLAIVGKRFPIEFKTMDGRLVNATTLSNKVVLVDFWATWCPVCVQEMPDIKKLYDRFHDAGFEVVGINFDDQTNTAQQFVHDHGLPWPQYYGGSDNKYGGLYGINLLPQGWLVDRKGIVQDIHSHIDRDAKVEKLMAR